MATLNKFLPSRTIIAHIQETHRSQPSFCDRHYCWVPFLSQGPLCTHSWTMKLEPASGRIFILEKTESTYQAT